MYIEIGEKACLMAYDEAYLDISEFSKVEVSLLLEALDGEPHVYELLGEVLQLRRHLRRDPPRGRRRARLGSDPIQARLWRSG